MGWKWQKSGDSVRKGIKKVPFSHVIATFFVFSLVSGEVESSLVGKSGREIWISVFAMMISCPELVKIKRGNKIKEVRSGVVGTAGVRDGVRCGVVGTPTGMVGMCSGTDIITTDRIGARSGVNGMDSGRGGALSSTIITARGRVGALSRADGHGRGHDGGEQREI